MGHNKNKVQNVLPPNHRDKEFGLINNRPNKDVGATPIPGKDNSDEKESRVSAAGSPHSQDIHW